jgi:2-oxoglutarate dehydrogenase E1 component
VPGEWRDYFEKLPRVEGAMRADVPHSTVVQHFERLGRNRLKARPERESTRVESAHELKQMRVQDLISAYRHRGHKKANIDPLGMMERPQMPILDLAYHHLTPADLEEVFHTGTFHYGQGTATLRELVDALEQTYCGSVGAEYMHIVDAGEQLWVQQRLESVRSRPGFTPEQKRIRARAPDRGGGAREIPARTLSGHQAFRPRGWRELSRCCTSCCSGWARTG